MKTLEDLKAIRERAFKEINLRNKNDKIKVVVGMATSGIASGAPEVLDAIVSHVSEKELSNVEITMNGKIEALAMNPVVEVYSQDGVKTTYVKIDAEKAKKIIEEHIIKGNIIEEFLMENN